MPTFEMNMMWISRWIRLVLPGEKLSRSLASVPSILPVQHSAPPGYRTSITCRYKQVDTNAFALCVQQHRCLHSETDTRYAGTGEISDAELQRQERLGVEVTSDNYVVKYVEEENEFFHEFMESHPSYQRYILNPGASQNQKVIQTQTSSELKALPSDAEAVLLPYAEGVKFKTAGILTDLEHLLSLDLGSSDLLFKNSHYITLCDCLVQNIPSMSDDYLFHCMQILSRFNFRRCIVTDLRMSRMRFSRAFNQECVTRCSQWDLPKQLLAADFFYSLRTSQWSSYLLKLFKEAEEDLPTASKEELILLLYHANLARQPPWRKDILGQVVSTLYENTDSLSVEECGIMCLSFFKTRQPLKHHGFLIKIAELLRDNMAEIQPVCLSAIFKCLQMSTNKTMVKGIPEFFDMMVQVEPKAQARLQDLPAVTTMHLLDIYHHLHNVSESLVNAVCEKIVAEGFADWRLKDMARVARILGNLQLELPSRQAALASLLQELQSESRQKELLRHLDCLLMALLGLAFSDVYPHALISLVLSQEGQDKLRKAKMDFRRDLYQLAESVHIEAPNCPPPSPPIRGAKSSGQRASVVWRRHSPETHQKGTKTSGRDLILTEVANTLTRILGGSDCMKIHNLLDNFEIPDIELQVHPCGNPIPVTRWQSGAMNVSKDSTSKSSAENNVAARLLHMATAGTFRRIAVLIHGHNAYYTLRTDDGESNFRLLGYHIMKGRQLQKLGYDVVQIPFFEFAEVQQKRDYIRNKIFGEIRFDDLD